MNIPDAPPALAPLLRRLAAEAETEVTQHEYTPEPDKWYAGRTLDGLGGGDHGPYDSAEAAIVALVRHLWTRYDEVCDERDRAEREAQELRQALSTADARAVVLRAELQAERGEVAARLHRGELALSKLLDALNLADGHARHDPRLDAPGVVRMPAEVWRMVAGSRKAAVDAWADPAELGEAQEGGAS